ncbi:hypothetical protein DWW99_01615 [[Clostridium] leptum]|nr:hypothetical protein DWW99_01615 [[Clostridium] leptum]
MKGAWGLQLPDNHNESGGQGRAKPVLFSLALCEFVVIFAPRKLPESAIGPTERGAPPQKRRGGEGAQRAPGAIATKREPRRRKARGSPKGAGQRSREKSEGR